MKTPELTPELWHYTCDHGRQALGETGVLATAYELASPERQALMPWWSKLVWLTDLSTPQREGLGLTSSLLQCDRTAHRYRVTDPSTCARWVALARHLPRPQREELELAPGAMPIHWWISVEPVPVELSP